jgi:hypothetical protein
VSEDTVSQVHRPGFRFKEHVLRAPEVVVAQPVDAADRQDENAENVENVEN